MNVTKGLIFKDVKYLYSHSKNNYYYITSLNRAIYLYNQCKSYEIGFKYFETIYELLINITKDIN